MAAYIINTTLDAELHLEILLIAYSCMKKGKPKSFFNSIIDIILILQYFSIEHLL